MKGLIQEYGLILVSVAAILICLLFGKQVFQHDIKDATVSNIAKLTQNNDSFNSYVPGTTLSVEGHEVIVLEKKEDKKYLVMEKKSLDKMQFQPLQDDKENYLNIGTYIPGKHDKNRYDVQAANTYENSYIDKYLNETWYSSLPTVLKNAIVPTEIVQTGYKKIGSNPKWKYTNAGFVYNEGTKESPNWLSPNKANIKDDDEGAYPYSLWKDVESKPVITRNVFVPSIKEISNVVNLSSGKQIYNYLKKVALTKYGGDGGVWTRDYDTTDTYFGLAFYHAVHSLYDCSVVTVTWFAPCPTYVLDTSKVHVEVTGLLNYK